jgi:hypothetical protein
MRDPQRLRTPRLISLKNRVPPGLKRVPKAAQSRLMTAWARRVRAHVSSSDAILVSGAPRSGSTWLFELLASDQDVLPLFEPFHPAQNPKFGPFADPVGYLATPGTPAEDESLRHLAREVYAGRELTRWSTVRTPLRRIRTARRTLVKDVRVNRALGWLDAAVPVPTVLLVRHPCAVVESMLRADEEWRRWGHDDVAAVVEAAWAGTGPVPAVPRDRPELLAALCALDLRVALEALQGRPHATIVAYEDLVTEPEAELRRLEKRLGLSLGALEPRRPSFTTLKSSPLRHGGDPLTSWQSRLPERTAHAIVDTAHRFGVTLYAAGPRPDRDVLERASSGG